MKSGFSEAYEAERKDGIKDLELMTDHELLVLMVRNQKSEKQHQLISLIILGVFTLAAVIALLVILPKAYVTLEKADALIVTINDRLSDVKTSLEDFNRMAESVTGTINVNEENIQESISKISSIDIDSLNKAIKDLSDIIDPLARLFGGRK